MAITEQSPMRELASLWITSRPPSPLEVSASRARLFTAATHEITFKSRSRISYDPLLDPLFKWCSQWLDVAEGSRKSIDDDVDFHFHLTMDPIPLSHKLLASGELIESPAPEEPISRPVSAGQPE
jgi:hypothetical protein